jgi:hypothetical protein
MFLLHPKGYESIHDLINLKMKAELSFETSGSNYPTHAAALQKACFLDTKRGLQLT